MQLNRGVRESANAVPRYPARVSVKSGGRIEKKKQKQQNNKETMQF